MHRAAAFAGVTVATLHDYHRHGLINEPQYDNSGTPRYRPPELLRLVQVRTLLGAGVRQTEISDLLNYLADIERILGRTR
ncbi:MerR family transcriptional regulator [Nocardia sp. NPDC006044]|uniref:MerR family transcriptional regulator n=1 Tax=Nocardia sp. NPDC006044 TaxID=3364306 RepID=UPI0036CF99BB